MRYSDLRYTNEEYGVAESEPPIKIFEESVFDLWPSFPEELLEGNTDEEILEQSIDALIDVLGCNCLAAEYTDGVVIVHCGGLDAEVQNKLYNFKLANG